LLELPIGFADLCFAGDISPSVITILKWIARSQSMGTKDNAWLDKPGWKDESHQLPETTTINMLLLQGVIASCHQSGFTKTPLYFSVNYGSLDAVEQRLTSISDAELASIAEDRCMRDALVWIYLCAAAALQSGTQKDKQNQSDVPSHLLLLKRIFRLFDNPKQLWWSNIGRTINRFWMPERLVKSWKQCWYDSLGHCF
jgi:hypothetical protein